MKNFDEQIEKAEKQIKQLNNKKKTARIRAKASRTKEKDKAVNRARGNLEKCS